MNNASSASVPESFPQRFYQPPEGATQVLLIRHGQSAAYVRGRPFDLIDGQGDPPLSELGHHQAALVADRLAGEGVEAIYTSTLTRTKQTAAPLVAAIGIEPVVEPDVREVFLGSAEGGQFRELMADGDPTALAVIETGEWGLLPGAESTADLTRRTTAAIDRMVAHHPGRLVAVFCHGGVIAALLAHAAGCHARVFSGARHTSLNHLVIPGPGAAAQEWTIRSFNDGAHSGPLTRDFATDEPAAGRRVSSR